VGPVWSRLAYFTATLFVLMVPLRYQSMSVSELFRWPRPSSASVTPSDTQWFSKVKQLILPHHSGTTTTTTSKSSSATATRTAPLIAIHAFNDNNETHWDHSSLRHLKTVISRIAYTIGCSEAQYRWMVTNATENANRQHLLSILDDQVSLSSIIDNGGGLILVINKGGYQRIILWRSPVMIGHTWPFHAPLDATMYGDKSKSDKLDDEYYHDEYYPDPYDDKNEEANTTDDTNHTTDTTRPLRNGRSKTVADAANPSSSTTISSTSTSTNEASFNVSQPSSLPPLIEMDKETSSQWCGTIIYEPQFDEGVNYSLITHSLSSSQSEISSELLSRMPSTPPSVLRLSDGHIITLERSSPSIGEIEAVELAWFHRSIHFV
jgi:hypothetical protein